jgi:hypothetical protein
MVQRTISQYTNLRAPIDLSCWDGNVKYALTAAKKVGGPNYGTSQLSGGSVSGVSLCVCECVCVFVCVKCVCACVCTP